MKKNVANQSTAFDQTNWNVHKSKLIIHSGEIA